LGIGRSTGGASDHVTGNLIRNATDGEKVKPTYIALDNSWK